MRTKPKACHAGMLTHGLEQDPRKKNSIQPLQTQQQLSVTDFFSTCWIFRHVQVVNSVLFMAHRGACKPPSSCSSCCGGSMVPPFFGMAVKGIEGSHPRAPRDLGMSRWVIDGLISFVPKGLSRTRAQWVRYARIGLMLDAAGAGSMRTDGSIFRKARWWLDSLARFFGISSP